LSGDGVLSGRLSCPLFDFALQTAQALQLTQLLW